MATCIDPFLLERLGGYRERLAQAKEQYLANLAMIGEIPAPTGGEERRAAYLLDRYNEAGIQDYGRDEAGNAMGILPGTGGKDDILVIGHLDTIHAETEDHTVNIEPDQVLGRGLADNALGAAALSMLPGVLEALGVRLRSTLILLGTAGSLGRGNLSGIRFFLGNNARPLRAALCLEGVRLGRLNFTSIGMLRGEITCTVPDEYDWSRFGAAGAVTTLNEVLNRIMAIPLPTRPRTSIVFGSIEGGSGYSVIPTQSLLRFEIRSESAEIVHAVSAQISDIAEEVSAQTRGEVNVDIFAQRLPGGLRFGHPVVGAARQVMAGLGIEHRIGPSTSELAALIDAGVPALTLGLTRGTRTPGGRDRIEISPIFSGLAQVIGVLEAVDGQDEP